MPNSRSGEGRGGGEGTRRASTPAPGLPRVEPQFPFFSRSRQSSPLEDISLVSSWALQGFKQLRILHACIRDAQCRAGSFVIFPSGPMRGPRRRVRIFLRICSCEYKHSVWGCDTLMKQTPRKCRESDGYVYITRHLWTITGQIVPNYIQEKFLVDIFWPKGTECLNTLSTK